MHPLQFLLEARQEYTDMVFNIPIHLQDGRTVTTYDADFDSEAPENARSPLGYYVDQIRETMVRRDRIVWAMRYLKYLLAREIHTMVTEELAMEVSDEDGDEYQGFFTSKFGSPPAPEQPEADEIIRRLSWLDMDWIRKEGDCYQLIDDLLKKVGHFIQVGEALAHNEDRPSPNNKLRAYVFDRQPVLKVVDDLQKIERETREENRSGVKSTTGVSILTFKNKWAWFDLQSWCDDSEAASMGHCGNRGGKAGQTVLSLREPLKRGWLPHATFILDTTTRALGEMKGYANNKPPPKYHPYIVELLASEAIRKVVGGGYRPEGNFCLYVNDGMPEALNGWTDLSPELAQDLHQRKPQIWWEDNVCQYCLHTIKGFGTSASDQQPPCALANQARR